MSDEAPKYTGAQRFSVPLPEEQRIMVKEAHWKRIRRRVGELENQPSVDWLLTAASTAVSIGIGTIVAALVLPNSGGTKLGRSVVPALWAIGIAATVLGIVLGVLYWWMRKNRAVIAADICHEMDTIHAAEENEPGPQP